MALIFFYFEKAVTSPSQRRDLVQCDNDLALLWLAYPDLFLFPPSSSSSDINSAVHGIGDVKKEIDEMAATVIELFEYLGLLPLEQSKDN